MAIPNQELTPPVANPSSNAEDVHATKSKTASLACLECRRKHLKCDGKMPSCSACAKLNYICAYKPSRRGWKGPGKRRGIPVTPSSSEETNGSRSSSKEASSLDEQPQPSSLDETWFSTLDATVFPPDLALSFPLDPLDFFINIPEAAMSTIPFNPVFEDDGLKVPSHEANTTVTRSGATDFVDLFYLYFHPAHPILPPRNIHHPPDGLLDVIEYIGSHYVVSDATSEQQQDQLRLILQEKIRNMPCSGHKVQALLLFSIVLHARNEAATSYAILQNAVDMATDIGMNWSSTASMQSGGNSLLEESWRRTWWEIFVTDRLLSAFHQKTSPLTANTPNDHLLPCEEEIFAKAGEIPDLLYPDDFDNRAFLDPLPEFSSFAYRIEAARLISRVGSGDKSVEISLRSYFQHLPESKSHSAIIGDNGVLDEMLFQAHMLVNSALIQHHLPRSDVFGSRPANANVLCAKTSLPIQGSNGFALRSTSAASHAILALDAAQAISSLLILPMPQAPTTLPRLDSNLRHTPYLTCVIVLSTITQLSFHAVKHEASDNDDVDLDIEGARDRVTLAIGTLKTIGSIWRIADHVMGEIRGLARDVMMTQGRRSIA